MLNKLKRVLLSKFRSNLFCSLFSVSFQSLFFTNDYSRLEPKSSHINLLMNGPCLNADMQSNVDYFRASDSLCVNHFADSTYYSTVKPSFYLLQDHYFWSNQVDASYKAKREKTFENLRQKTAWPVIVYVPSFCNEKNSLLEKLSSPYITVRFYFAQYIVDGRDKYFRSHLGNEEIMFFLWKNGLAAPPPENVLVGSLFLAEKLGYSSIHIYGANLSFFKDLMVDQSNNDVYMSINHFYEKNNKRLLYVDKAFKYKSSLLHELKKQTKVFCSIYFVAAYLKKQKVKVLNMSSQSYLDCFDRSFEKE